VHVSVLSRTFRIGDLEVASPVILAALAGYSDAAYRGICRRFGAPYCTTEMMLDRSVLTRSKRTRQLLRIGDDDHPIAAQLIGSDPETMAAAARAVCQPGFDAVDLNFACPARKVLRRRRGGYLMAHARQALDIVRAVLDASDRPVTIKLRQRFHERDDMDAFYRIAEGAFDSGVAAICLHARSVEAGYRGEADWAFLAEVKRRFAGRTVIGSGDVLEPSDALHMLARTGVDAVAVGRGALGNPWFFRQVRDLARGRPPHRPDLAEQRKVLERHFEQACALYGPDRGPKIMRKFGIKYARMHPAPGTVRSAFVRVSRPAHWRRVLENCYDARETGRMPAFPQV
jgi:nifR3 family TIM-barrel protein